MFNVIVIYMKRCNVNLVNFKKALIDGCLLYPI